MEKRKIESAAELVNALVLGVKVEHLNEGDWRVLNLHAIGSKPLGIVTYEAEEMKTFRYADPVEVVELWGISILNEPIFREEKPKKPTHKQTQIIQNNRVIWTKTEEL